MRARWFAHVDMDAFYAAVEVLDFPELDGLPVAVGGAADARGVIAAASYPAREFGVRSAMPTAQALRLCPQLVLRPGRGRRYAQKSREVMAILRSVSPLVEPLSLDEAFLDLSGCDRLHAPDGSWQSFGERLRDRIFRETGLWASIGMGETRRIAKIASDLRKPRGLVVIADGAGPAFLQSLPVERLWGVGPKLREHLHLLGLRTGGDIARTPRIVLQESLGTTGLALQDMVCAREQGEVVPDRENKSISHEETFARDVVGSRVLEPALLHLCEKVGNRMRRAGMLGRVVQLKIRDRSFRTVTRRTTLSRPIDSERALFATGRRMLRALDWDRTPVRLIGIGMCQLTAAPAWQADLFDSRAAQAWSRLEPVLDGVHERYGAEAIARATALLRPTSPRWDGSEEDVRWEAWKRDADTADGERRQRSRSEIAAGGGVA
jgi:DNA polymerase-4